MMYAKTIKHEEPWINGLGQMGLGRWVTGNGGIERANLDSCFQVHQSMGPIENKLRKNEWLLNWLISKLFSVGPANGGKAPFNWDPLSCGPYSLTT